MHTKIHKTPLNEVLENAIAPLDSLTELLRTGGWHDIAQVSEALLCEARAQFGDVVHCLEVGCGKPLFLRRAGDLLLPVRCVNCPRGCAHADGGAAGFAPPR